MRCDVDGVYQRLVDDLGDRGGGHHGEGRLLTFVEEVGVEGCLDFLVPFYRNGFAFQIGDVADLVGYLGELLPERLVLYLEGVGDILYGFFQRMLHGDYLCVHLPDDGVVVRSLRSQPHPFEYQFVVFVDGVRQGLVLYSDIDRQDADFLLSVEDVAYGGEHLQLYFRLEQVVFVLTGGFEREFRLRNDVYRGVVAFELFDGRIDVGEFTFHCLQAFVDEPHGRFGRPALAVDGVFVIDLDELVRQRRRLLRVMVGDGDIDDIGKFLGLRYVQRFGVCFGGVPYGTDINSQGVCSFRVVSGRRHGPFEPEDPDRVADCLSEGSGNGLFRSLLPRQPVFE